MFDGRVGVKHQGHIVDVDTTGSDVGGHEGGCRAVREGGEVALAGVLRQVAVQVDSTDAHGRELGGQLASAVLGAGEHHHTTLPGEAGHGVDAFGIVDHEHAVVEQYGCFHLGSMRHRVVHVTAHECIDTAGQGGRKEHALPVLRGGIEDALHRGEEALIGHVVGFVEHADLDSIEAHVAGLHVVEQAAGAGHHDFHAPLECGALRAVPDTTEHGDRAEAAGAGQGVDHRGNLVGQFTGGHQHEGTRSARGGAHRGCGEAGHEGKREGEGLARAGAALAEHITALQRVGQRDALDGERLGESLCRKHLGEHCRHPEGDERLGRCHMLPLDVRCRRRRCGLGRTGPLIATLARTLARRLA